MHPTPPPDNYGRLSCCSHLNSVLESKAKENVLANYKQAISISFMENTGKIYTQKKDGSTTLKAKLQDLKLKSLACTECTMSNFFHNFICLQCPHVGCFMNSNHAHSHYKLQQHLFAIDCQNGLLYCFLCGDYINSPLLNTIRLELLSASETDVLKEEEIQMESNYSNPSMSAAKGLKGFINLGSTCFMSSILQSFIHNPLIKYQFFNNDDHFFNCESNFEYSYEGSDIDQKNACITCSIDKVFKDFYTSSTHEGYGMTNLLMTAWYKKKSLAGFQEQDAHEFWQFLLNEFHSDHERIMKVAGQPESECKCITHSTFSGELQSSIKCLNCHEITRTVDPLIDLSLEINHVKSKLNNETISLYDCLDLFTKDEKLDVMYTCQYCDEKSKAIKSLKIKKLPPVLSIQLKRFEHNLMNDSSSKIQVPVKTPLFLNITKYTSDYSETEAEIDSDKVYELFSVVSHIGSVNTGHYIVMVKDGDGQWFKFDDSVISSVSHKEVINTNAYLLFYITHRI